MTDDDFYANYGHYYLRLYGGSPIAAVRDCFPRYTWNEWMFARTPVGFWNKRENRKRYIRWLGRRLKLKRAKDWRKVGHHRRRQREQHNHSSDGKTAAKHDRCSRLWST